MQTTDAMSDDVPVVAPEVTEKEVKFSVLTRSNCGIVASFAKGEKRAASFEIVKNGKTVFKGEMPEAIVME